MPTLLGLYISCFSEDDVSVSYSVLAFLLHDVFGVLQHLLLPQVKEVGWIGVKLQSLFTVLPTKQYLLALRVEATL